MKKYVQSCQTEFWHKVFEAETEYLLHALEGTRDVLSIGCGPAIIEKNLSEHGFRIIGLDVSKEALDSVPDSIRTVVARAEDIPFPESSFDAVISITSLQFIKDYKMAIIEIERILRPKGKLIAMLLNPESYFFKEKFRHPDSYVRKIRHTNIHQIESTIREKFEISTEYFLGIKGKNLFESQNPQEASLYIIKGTKRP